MKLKALSVYLVITLSALGNAAPAIAVPLPALTEDPYKDSPPLTSLACPGECDKLPAERTATSVFTRCKFELDETTPVESIWCQRIAESPDEYSVRCSCKVNLVELTRNECEGEYYGPTCSQQSSVLVTDTYNHRGVRSPAPNCAGDVQHLNDFFGSWCADKCREKNPTKDKDLEGVCCPKNSDTNGGGAPEYNSDALDR